MDIVRDQLNNHTIKSDDAPLLFNIYYVNKFIERENPKWVTENDEKLLKELSKLNNIWHFYNKLM